MGTTLKTFRRSPRWSPKQCTSRKSHSHCIAVIHNSDNAKENIYAYHFSDINKHDWCQTKCVEMDIMEHFLAKSINDIKKN